jgi:REP element-mobilizing transposase RayT
MNENIENSSSKQTMFQNKYRIESTRLKDYDYSSDGAYFITICTKNREHLFGEIIDGRLPETEQSKICAACWADLPNHYDNCVLDAFMIMPNHVHIVVIIRNRDDNDGDASIRKRVETGLKCDNVCVRVETGLKPVSTTSHMNKAHSVSEIIRGFKTFTARKINIYQNTPGEPFWQLRFYDHVVRNEEALNHIREYIGNNPMNWENDRNNQVGVYF